jgi:peptide/nickel transport system substrate-binding protein
MKISRVHVDGAVMANERQRKTFLSYSRVNKDFAIKLAKELKAEGFSVWLDQLDIPAGTRWDVELEKALEECEIFMIIMTPASIGSENVRDEIGYAIDNGKRFLPVLLENCNVPLRLRRFQYVDFTNKTFDDGVESAKDLLRNLIAQTTIPRREVPADAQDESAQAEADRLAPQKAESDRVAKQKAEDERLAKVKAETERKAKEEADRIATQKADNERLAKSKADAERKAKEEADRLAAQKAESDRVAKQKAEDERLAKVKAETERKAKEEADRLAAQKADREAQAEAERKAKEIAMPVQATPVGMKSEPVSAAPAQKKPVSKGPMIGIIAVVAVVCIAVVGIGINALKRPPAATQAPAASNPATEAPSVNVPATDAPVSSTCSPSGVALIDFPQNGKSIVEALYSEPTNIVPYYDQNGYFSVAQMTLAGLAEWDDKGNYVPELAAEIPSVANGGISPDGLTITWQLKPCLFWSDGEPITSADVKFTWASIVDPNNTPNSTYGYEKIKNIEIIDDQTFTIQFNELNPVWQLLFATSPYGPGSILPSHILQGKTGLQSDPFVHQPTVSSGPFVISEWVTGDHITLLPNPNFYKGRAKLDRVIIKVTPDELPALQAGDVDLAPNLSMSDMATLASLEPKVHTKFSPDGFVLNYFFNQGTTVGVNNQGQSDKDGFCPFQDGRVRKAILLGINRQAIVDSLFYGNTKVPASLWPNSYWSDDSLQPMGYDSETAKQLLDEAGYVDRDGDGVREGECNGQLVKFSINFSTTTIQTRQTIAQMVKADLALIGIDFQPNFIPGGTFYGSYANGGPLARGDFDMASYGYGFYPNPSASGYFSCSQVPSANNPNNANSQHLCDAQLDDLASRIDMTADTVQRKQALINLQQYIYNNTLAIPIYEYVGVTGYADRFIIPSFGEIGGINWNTEEWDIK